MNKNLIYNYLILSLFSFIGLKSHAQILNLDRENGLDTLNRRFHTALDFSFALDKQKGDFLDINNKTEFDLKVKKKMILIFLNSTELSLSGKSVIDNNGYFQLRFRDNDKRKIFPDTYAQYQWNGVLGMKQRFLFGSNMRINWMEGKETDLYSGFGAFYEYEFWDPAFATLEFADTLTSVNRQIFRLNISLKYAVKLGEKVDLVLINYAQFPLNEYFLKPRWFLDSNVNIAFNEKWSALIHYSHNFDLYRPLPIDSYYYSLTIGFRVQF